MSEGIVVAWIGIGGAFGLAIFNLIVLRRTNSKKDRDAQHKQMMDRFDKVEEKEDRNASGIQAVLRSDLYHLLETCQTKGFANAMDRSNFLNMYDRYHSMGANGVMDNVKDQFLALPVEKPIKIRKKKEVKD